MINFICNKSRLISLDVVRESLSDSFKEIHRVLKPGGYIGDLEMIWKKRPPNELVRETREIWGGFETMTLEEWTNLFEKLGLVEVRAVDFSDEISDIGKTFMKELGLKGMIKIAYKLLLCSDIRKTMSEYMKIFKEYKDYIGYGYIVGRKSL